MQTKCRALDYAESIDVPILVAFRVLSQQSSERHRGRPTDQMRPTRSVRTLSRT